MRRMVAGAGDSDADENYPAQSEEERCSDQGHGGTRGGGHRTLAPPAKPPMELSASTRIFVPGRAALTICPLPR